MIASKAELTERLDERDLLDDARGSGVYALEASVPDTEADVRSAWQLEHDRRPADDTLQRLADAEKVAYVGASKGVYSRLSDHITKTRRQTAFLSVFPPARIIDIWPHPDPFDAEYNRALRLARDYRVWCDGELLG